MDPVDAKFGMTGPFTNIAKTFGFTGLKVQAGCDRPEYYHRRTDQIRCDSDFYNSWGIERQGGPFNVDAISDVTLNEAEEVGYMHEVCRNPAQVPAFGELLLKTDYLVLPFLVVSVAVNGKGELPASYNEDNRGQVVSPWSIAACRGLFSLDIPETIQRECSEEYPLTDFWQFTLNFGVDEKSGDPDGVAHLITLTTEADAFRETFASLQRSVTMNETSPPRLTETITNYPDT